MLCSQVRLAPSNIRTAATAATHNSNFIKHHRRCIASMGNNFVVGGGSEIKASRSVPVSSFFSAHSHTYIGKTRLPSSVLLSHYPLSSLLPPSFSSSSSSSSFSSQSRHFVSPSSSSSSSEPKDESGSKTESESKDEVEGSISNNNNESSLNLVLNKVVSLQTSLGESSPSWIERVSR
jgi:hypothetical protein